jgi:hypothetical protein
VRVKACVAVADLESVTLAVNDEVPEALGVPDSKPVVPSSVIPAGREPAEIDQVYGVVPPVAPRAAPYPDPVFPPGREVVVMVSALLVAVTVTAAVAFFVLSATLVAVTETEVVELTVGAEKAPAVEMLPALAVHVTPVLLVPVT